MNKELRELMDKIKAKKEEVRNLTNQDKLEEAKAAKDKDELKKLSDKFDLLYDLEEEKEEEQKKEVKEKAEKETSNKGKKVLNSFVNVIKATLTRKPVNDEDVEILNSTMEEGSEENGGLTVPQDLRTQIKELRRSEDSLEELVNVEPVSTVSGSRVIEVNADQTPFDNVDEKGDFPEAATPTFKKISYKILKKGGILKVTRELLQDSAENILGYLRKWIAKKAKATRNFLILKKLDDTFTDVKAIAAVDDLKKIFNIELDPAIAVSSKVLTNQDGFNWLDTLKDSDGKYILQPDPTAATKRLLFGKYPVIVVSNKTLKTKTNKAPIYFGDFKEAITIFDRETLTIEFSTEAGDLWSKDLTGIKVRERLDIQVVDDEAVVKGEVDTTAKVKAK
ncbi:phage major capsid protein [Clostridium baratii]|uniref:phage major capsid protein n=1 Tax=Clostridium baratii TaxID=1561 RepID=UPI0030D4B589